MKPTGLTSFTTAIARLSVCTIFQPPTKSTTVRRKSETIQVDEMKTFSKVKFLEFVGLLGARFDNETKTFERFFRHRLKASMTLLLVTSFSLRHYISTLFKREDPIQLQIGSVGVSCFVSYQSIT